MATIPAPTMTVRQLVTRSLVLINGLARNEVIDASDLQDGIAVFNELLDNWSTESIAVWGKADETFPLVPGVGVYTIGPGGDFDTDRPVSISSARVNIDTVSTPVKLIPQSEYDRISLNQMQSNRPSRMVYINENPLGRLLMWPVPNNPGLPSTISMNIGRIIQNITDPDTTIIMPPGYSRALRYNLAVDLWPENNSPNVDINTIKALAISSKADIQRANMVDPTMSFEDVPDSYNRYDYYALY